MQGLTRVCVCVCGGTRDASCTAPWVRAKKERISKKKKRHFNKMAKENPLFKNTVCRLDTCHYDVQKGGKKTISESQKRCFFFFPLFSNTHSLFQVLCVLKKKEKKARSSSVPRNTLLNAVVSQQQ